MLKRFTVEHAAAAKGVSAATVRRAISTGELPALREGKRVILDPHVVESWRQPTPIQPRAARGGTR